MANNVILNFTADTGGLDEANQKMEALKDREQELLDKIKQLKAEQNAATLFAKNTQEQAKATKEYGDKINEVRKQVNQTKKSIEDLSKAQDNLKKTIPAEAVNQSFRTMLRNIREQIAYMELMGQTGSEEYQRLVAEAGNLVDIQGDVNRQLNNMASDTRVFDTILEGTQLASGGFSVLTGTMSLFGEENKDVQQLMLKMQSLIAINTGLQQIQNATQKESNLMLAIGSIQTKAKTAAEIASTKSTITATIAQKAFNLVAAANPYVLLAIALITVVGALYIFAQNTDVAADSQKKLNDLEARHLDLLKDIADFSARHNKERIRELETELSLASARGKSTSEIRRIEDDLARARMKDHNERVGFYKDEITNLEANNKVLMEQKVLLDAINDAKDTGSDTYRLEVKLGSGELKDVDIDKAIEIVQGRVNNYGKKVEIGTTLKTEGEDLGAKEKEAKAKRDKEDFERGKKNAVALSEYKVLMAKKGSKEELESQIVAANTKLRVDLQNTDITKGERLKRTKETLLEIERLENEYRRAQLQEDLNIIEAGLAASKEGTIEEYNYRVKSLEKQREIDLAQLNLTDGQKLLIEKKYLKDLDKLTEDYVAGVAEREINTNISSINARLASVIEGSKEEYDLRIELARANAQAEREEVNNSIKNEELKAARIKEINANLQKEIKIITSEESAEGIQKAADKETLIITQQYEKNLISKRDFEHKKLKIAIEAMEKEIAFRKAMGEDTTQMEIKLSEAKKEIAMSEKEMLETIAYEAASTLQSIANTLYGSQKERLNQQLDDLNHYYTTDAEAAKKNANLKLISEEEMVRKQLEIKRELAKKEKEEALFNAFINMAVGITKAWSLGPIIGPIMAALVAAASLVQINAIASRQLPKYWKGRKGGKGEYAMIGEQGPEMMWIPQGASIMPAHDSLRAMNGDMSMMKKWNMPAISPNIPVMPSISAQLVNDARKSPEMKMDYDMLGRAVAKYQKPYPAPKVNVSFDRSGVSVTTGNRTTTYLNTRGHV